MSISREQINRELEDFDCVFLVRNNGNRPFFIEKDYFSKNILPIQNEIYLERYKVVNPFQIPTQYFESFPKKIMELVHSKNETSVFSVPEGYFESFSSRVMDQIHSKEKRNTVEEKPAKVVRFSRAKVLSLYRRVSVAAILLLTVSVGGLKIKTFYESDQNYSKAVHTDLNSALKDVSDSELQNYLEDTKNSNEGASTPLTRNYSVDVYGLGDYLEAD